MLDEQRRIAEPRGAAPTRGRANRPGGSYRPEIDGLRALAVLAVIVNHIHGAALPSGYLGVDVFFVISGFVITGSLASQAPSRSLGSFLLNFYSRRIRRILPALLVCVVGTSVLVCLFDTRPTPSLQTGITALFGFSNLVLHKESVDYFARSSQLNAFLHTWSLGVEEQFYLLFPLLLWGSGWLRGAPGGSRRLVWWLSLLGAASLVAFLLLARLHQPAAYFLMPPRFWELAAGALLFLAHRSGLLAGPWQRLPSLVPLGLLVAALCLPQRLEVTATLAVVALTVAVIAMGLVGSDHRLVGLLSSPGPVAIGLLSYSLYLWHWPVLVLSRWTIGIELWTLPLQALLIGALAAASYRWVEQPLRRRPWANSSWRTILYGLGAAGLAALGLWALKIPLAHRFYLGTFRGNERSEKWTNLGVAGTTIDPDFCNTVTQDATVLADQEAFARLTSRCSAEPAQAVGGQSPRRPHVFVVGDSHAMAFSPVAAGLLRKGGYGISILSRPGCPFPDTPHGHLQPNCSRFLRATEQEILHRGRSGDTVVVVNYLLNHLGEPHQLADTRNQFRGADGLPISDGEGKWQVWRMGLARFSSQARAKGMAVVVVGATPRNLEFFTCRQEWFNIQGSRRCDGLVATEQGWARRLNQRLAADLPAGVGLFDPMPVLCPRGCRNAKLSGLLRDTDHLSLEGAQRLAPAFLEFLRDGRPGEAPRRAP